MEAIGLVPFSNFDYSAVSGVSCENVIGYASVPIGVVGPLLIDGNSFFVPLATTEGALIASISRGAKALSENGGVSVLVIKDEMTRAPILEFGTAKQAAQLQAWLKTPQNFGILKASFESTSKFAKLQSITPYQAGRQIFLRIGATTGDAMGMNMLTKGVDALLKKLRVCLGGFAVRSLSGNACCDKKPSAINWVGGRGKSVVAEAVITEKALAKTLKVDASSMASLCVSK